MNAEHDDVTEACALCHDTGWEARECTGRFDCGRPRAHRPHTYTVVCACRPINREFQAKRGRRTRRAA